MEHENLRDGRRSSRSPLPRAPLRRSEQLIVIMNKHRRGNDDIFFSSRGWSYLIARDVSLASHLVVPNSAAHAEPPSSGFPGEPVVAGSRTRRRHARSGLSKAGKSIGQAPFSARLLETIFRLAYLDDLAEPSARISAIGLTRAASPRLGIVAERIRARRESPLVTKRR